MLALVAASPLAILLAAAPFASVFTTATLVLGERVALGPLGSASVPDLLRLLAVPVFGWAALRDVKTRRVPNETWYPLIVLGVLALAWDAVLVLDAGAYRQRVFLIRVVISLGLVAPLGYAFWRIGGFGGADAKAVMVLALLFPATPEFLLRVPSVALPLAPAPLGVFSLTILSNTVVLGLLYPVVLALGNLVRGNVALPMVVGRPVAVPRIVEEYGRLLEAPDGYTRAGLDIDALRMYLRWRGVTLSALRADPVRHRDPASLPGERHAPGDGAIADGPAVADGGVGPEKGGGDLRPATEAAEAVETKPVTDAAAADGETEAADEPISAIQVADDPWSADLFLAEIEGTAYGTTPGTLRSGLEVLVAEDDVWISPGIPFIVPMFLGLIVALAYGDLLYALLVALGAV